MREVTIRGLYDSGALSYGDGYRTKRSEQGSDGYRILRVADITEGRIDLKGEDFVRREFAKFIGPKLSQLGDVLLTTKGTVGRVAVVPPMIEQVVYSPQLCYFRVRNGEMVDHRYLSYWFTSEAFLVQASHRSNNTDMAAYINLRDIGSLRLMLPEIQEQRAIAEVLGALDNKIAANERYLAVSDEWVRLCLGALSGNDIPLATFATNVRKQVDPIKLNKSTRYVGLEHIPRRRMWLGEVSSASSVTSTKSAFHTGDILFGKLRPYFHKVVYAPCEGVSSTDVMIVRAKDPRLSGYVLAAASSDRAVAATSAASEGTRMPRTKWSDLAAVKFPWPGEAVALEFSSKVQALATHAVQLSEESRLLAATRDELLPLLMSGKVTVREAEQSATDAVSDSAPPHFATLRHTVGREFE